MKTILTFVLAILISLFVCYLGTALNDHFERVHQLQGEVDYFHQKYQSKNGATTLWSGSKGKMVSYNLWSFDGGRNWYSVKWDGTNAVVEGEAEKVYPGLLRDLQAWDALMDYVTTNGPLNLSKSHDLALLLNANVGFEVKTNK